jgi:putative ABC transport system permease protein
MLIESVVVGIVGSLLGLVAGIGVSIALRGFLGVLGVDFPSTALQLLPRTVVLTVDDDGRGFQFEGRLNLDELDAARRGPVVIKERVRVLGGTMLIDSAPGRVSRHRVPRRTATTTPPRRCSSILLGLGVFLIWTGVLILGPVLSLVAAKIIGTPIARAFKVTGKMAQGNASRNPKRTARAAARCSSALLWSRPLPCWHRP